MLVLQALAIAATLGLLWLCAAVVGDLSASEQLVAEAVARSPESPSDTGG